MTNETKQTLSHLDEPSSPANADLKQDKAMVSKVKV